jgi:transposase-like protein
VSRPQDLAEALVARARAAGVVLTGPGGLLTGLTKQVLETALNAEMTEHLGHEHGGSPDVAVNTKSNVRNGYSDKTVRTEIGNMRIRVPRDLAGSFEPVIC